MNAYEKLTLSLTEKKSMLCVGLDTNIDFLPHHLRKDSTGVLKFNFSIIEATHQYASAYKINLAFYEQYGCDGFNIVRKTINTIPSDCFLILDAKRGDIGNTSKAYAKALFDEFNCDCVTVAPYMGEDSVCPFLDYKDKMVFLLALTSNKGSNDFQRLICDGKPLYKHVLSTSAKWADEKQLGYVIGATHPEELGDIRNEYPDRVFLVPGIGAQGGDIAGVNKFNQNGKALINVSRGIIAVSREADYMDVVNAKTKEFAGYFPYIV